MSLLLGDWLAQKPFSLALSAGFFGFYAHCGVLLALEEAGLFPSAYSGASAGAIVAGLRSSGCDAKQMLEILTHLQRRDFWDPGLGLGLLRGDRLRNLLDRLLLVSDFQSCCIPLSISVYDIFKRKTIALQSGNLADAMYASCAVPLLFQPIRIDGNWFVDGGIGDTWGLLGIPENCRVFCHCLPTSAVWSRGRKRKISLPEGENIACLKIDSLPAVSKEI